MAGLELYYENGQVMLEGSLQELERGGILTAWYKSGKKMAEIRNGKLTRWSEEGQLVEETDLVLPRKD